MREILFRGKRIDNGEWVYGFYFCMYHDDDRKHLHHFIIPLNVPIPKDKPIGEIQVEVDPTTVGQYTGLTANGNKIFEGDIVKHFTRASFGDLSRVEIGKVFWEEHTLQWKRTGKDINREKIKTFCMSKDCVYEVIGNIHDNPELLEVNNNG